LDRHLNTRHRVVAEAANLFKQWQTIIARCQVTMRFDPDAFSTDR
jgi:hypothetical protein